MKRLLHSEITSALIGLGAISATVFATRESEALGCTSNRNIALELSDWLLARASTTNDLTP